MKVAGVGLTDVGQKRKNNEDAFFVDNDRGVFVVADGMGGHKGGEVASRTAIETVVRALTPDAIAKAESDSARDRVSQVVGDALAGANTQIRERASADPALKGMGCTLSLMFCVGDRAMVGHVGDTRIYRRRDGVVAQLTEDHTFVSELVRRGTVDPANVHRHPHGNVLTRAVGSRDNLDVDTLLIDLRAGDRFLLCSDGLTKYVESDETLYEPLAVADFATIPEALVRWANESGGGDNVTVIVIEVS